MPLTTDIVATYRGPRRVIRRMLAEGEQEARALMFLIVACVLIFVAQWPRLRREAILDPSMPFDARVGGALMAWIFIVPLALYAVALLSFWLGRAVKGRGSAYGCRLALFWSLLAASPLWLLFGLTSGFFGAGPERVLTGAIALGVFLLFWALSYWEVQQHP
jgi:hypothetical protein